MEDQNKIVEGNFEEAKADLTDENKPTVKDKVVGAVNWVLNLRIRDMLVPVVVIGAAAVITIGVVGSVMSSAEKEKTEEEKSDNVIDGSFNEVNG